MLVNPFTPSEIAAGPDQFFGRDAELSDLQRSLPIGSVLIQGPIGIGKSSLLARGLDVMAAESCDTRVVVADRDVASADDAARVVLDSLVDARQGQGKFRLKFGLGLLAGAVEPNIEVESTDAQRDLSEGRPLAALKKILEADHRRRRAANRKLLILGIDEADKAPEPIARLVRSIWTHCQQIGVLDVRFVVAGVSPLHQHMVREDPGVERAFNRVLTLAPMTMDETEKMLWAKFTAVIEDAQAQDMPLGIEPEVIDRIAGLSGGHPHIVQLLGSHMVQHENADPDGMLSISDLLGVLERVCYEDRRATYAATLHMLEAEGVFDKLAALLGRGYVEEGFPTRIFRQSALEVADPGQIQWLVEHDILVARSPEEYGLVDEFLRVRIALDAEKPELRADVEAELVRQGRLLSWDEIQEYYQQADEKSEPPDDLV